MKKIIITGVTSGIGRALLLRLNQEGHHVIGVARSQERLEILKPLLKAPFDLIQADLSQTKDVIQAAKDIMKLHESIDVLINNAATVPGSLVLSEEGHEMQFQVNHLAVVTMTHALLQTLEKANGLIITTSSDAHKPAKYHQDRLERVKKYSLMGAYSETKLYNILFTKAFNRFVDTNVFACAVHPGLVNTDLGGKDTKGMMQKVWRFLARRGITPEASTQTYIDLINGTLKDHEYVSDRKPSKPTKVALNKSNQDHLWHHTNTLLNIKWKTKKA